MVTIELPEKPVDQYRLDWFRINVSDDWYCINRIHAIYHINSPFKGVRCEGAQIIDQWMVYENDFCNGRLDNWNMRIIDGYWHNCFLTMQEAKDEVLRRLNKYLVSYKDRVAYIEKSIKALKEK